MKTYTISSSETLYYETDIEANSEAEAKEIFLNTSVMVGDSIDSTDLEIQDIKLKSNN